MDLVFCYQNPEKWQQSWLNDQTLEKGLDSRGHCYLYLV